MNLPIDRRSVSILVAGVAAAAVIVWIVFDGRLAGWIRAQLGIRPSISISFADLSGDDSRKTAFGRFPGMVPDCRDSAPERVQSDCRLVVARVNGAAVDDLVFRFERDRLTSVSIVLPASEHPSFMKTMRAELGMWSKLDQRDAQGAALVAWVLPGGRLVMSEDSIGKSASTVVWTSKAGLFRETVREIAQLIQNETNLPNVTAVPQASGGARSYDTTSPFRRSFRHARAVPNEFSAQLAEWLAANAEDVPSPLILELAQRLLAANPADALRWYATFRTLLKYDAARCADETASRGSSGTALMALYPSIERYAQEHAAQWREARAAAYHWIKVRQIRSSPMWLCSSGMRAVRVTSRGEPQPVSVRELMIPEAAWPAAWRDVLAGESS